MYTQKENLESVQRDREILKLINGLQDNLISCKEIIDLLTTRIEKLEENKLESQQKLNVVLKAIDRIDNE
tara:strand:+ start:277 stop:486 length:210 start_codon:yes stop_codon:yes gene_type:complete